MKLANGRIVVAHSHPFSSFPGFIREGGVLAKIYFRVEEFVKHKRKQGTWCPGPELNRHARLTEAQDFKSCFFIIQDIEIKNKLKFKEINWSHSGLKPHKINSLLAHFCIVITGNFIIQVIHSFRKRFTFLNSIQAIIFLHSKEAMGGAF